MIILVADFFCRACGKDFPLNCEKKFKQQRKEKAYE
jgi:hypothetical protein